MEPIIEELELGRQVVQLHAAPVDDGETLVQMSVARTPKLGESAKFHQVLAGYADDWMVLLDTLADVLGRWEVRCRLCGLSVADCQCRDEFPDER